MLRRTHSKSTDLVAIDNLQDFTLRQVIDCLSVAKLEVQTAFRGCSVAACQQAQHVVHESATTLWFNSGTGRLYLQRGNQRSKRSKLHHRDWGNTDKKHVKARSIHPLDQSLGAGTGFTPDRLIK